MKALLLDVGNSRIKWGVIDGEDIRRTGHIEQSAIREKGLSALITRLPRTVETVFACNVAGTSIATRLSGAIGMHFDCDVHFARSEKRACGVTNGYRQARRLGVDRWVAMIGARTLCQTSSVVVDAGTAVTIDVLDDDGQHLGGQILPGFMLMANALATHTSDIANSGKRASSKARGLAIFERNTAGAVSQGVASAVIGAIERASTVLRQDGYDPTIFLTGGDAAHLHRLLEEEAVHRPNLVLEGLATILQSRQ
jgi:type III pantothenate kinase